MIIHKLYHPLIALSMMIRQRMTMIFFAFFHLLRYKKSIIRMILIRKNKNKEKLFLEKMIR